MSQTALDLKFDGLMIETHRDPENAWSDAAQQVTPEALDIILSHLIIRTEQPINTVEIQHIEELRKAISGFDDQMMEIISQRMKVVAEIAGFKKEYNMTIFQEAHWNQLLDKYMAKGTEKGLSNAFIMAFFKAIHQESIDIQTKIIHKK
jgi:chorismate mutase